MYSFNSIIIKYLLLLGIVYSVSFTEVYTKAGHTFSYQEKPKWVTDMTITNVSEDVDLNGSDMVYHSYIQQVNLLNDTALFYFEFEVIPLNGEGVSKVAGIQIGFDPSYQKLIIHDVSLKRDSLYNKFDPNKLNLLQREEQLERRIYDGRLTSSFMVEDVRIGDTLRYSYTISGLNPIFKGRYSDNFSVGWSSVVNRTAIRILSSSDKKLYIKNYETEIKPLINKIKDGDEYIWIVDNSKPILYEQRTPYWYNPYPEIEVSEYKNWKDVIVWANEIYNVNRTLSSELTMLIDRFKKNESNKEKLVPLVLDFVQDSIRYLGIEIGRDSYEPTDPSIVLKRRFGDCKDKALLMSLILNELGIECYPALVNSDRGEIIPNSLPSPFLFNHVIVKLTIDKKKYWFDPTYSYQEGLINKIYSPDYQYALVISEKNKKLEPMVIENESDPSITVRETYNVSHYDSLVELTIQSTYTGSEAEYQRYRFSNNSIQKMEKEYLNYYSKRFKGLKKNESIVFKDHKEENEFIVTEKYWLSDFFEKNKGKLTAYLPDDLVYSYVKLPEQLHRVSPLSLGDPVKIEQISEIHYPENIHFDTTDIYTMTFSDDFIKFHVEDYYKDSVLRVVYQYENVSDAVSAENIKEHLQLLREINDHLDYSYWISYDVTEEIKGIKDEILLSINNYIKGDTLEYSNDGQVYDSSVIKFCLEFEKEFNNRSASFINSNFNIEGLLNALQNSTSDNENDSIITATFRTRLQLLGETVLQNFGEESYAKFIRLFKSEQGYEGIYRVVDQESITFIRLAISGGQKLLIDDLFNYATASSIVESLKESVVKIFNELDNIQKIKDSGKTPDMSSMFFTQLMYKIQNKDFIEAMHMLNSIPKEIDDMRLLTSLKLVISREVNEDTYFKVLKDIDREWGEESDYSLMLVDYYIIEKKYKKAFAALNAISKKVGNDCGIETLRAGILNLMKDYPAALGTIYTAVQLDEDYEDAYWELLNTFVYSGQFYEATLVLDLLYLKYDIEIDEVELAKVEGYADFTQSKEFRKWLSES